MSSLRIVVIVIAAVVGLTLLRFQPWRRPQAESPLPGSAATPGQAAERQKLTVGFLPVT
jgi:hypothetical protein